MPRQPMGFELRGLEIALTNRTAWRWDGVGRASSGRTCAASCWAHRAGIPYPWSQGEYLGNARPRRAASQGHRSRC